MWYSNLYRRHLIDMHIDDWSPEFLSQFSPEAYVENLKTAQINYAMTDEYYMIERHDDSDPYFLPWSPNASANGRTLMMLMDMAN